MSRDIYQEVTDEVLAALEAGTVPWRQPWREPGGQRNLQSKKPYRGINQVLTTMSAQARGYEDPYWTTVRAANKAGGHVKKGERGTLVTFWKKLTIEDEDSGEERDIMFLRHYVVFNVAQCEGLVIPEIEEVESFEEVDIAELVLDAYHDHPHIRHGGGAAFYAPLLDYVQLPEQEQFDSPDAYCHVLFHELAHSTGHESRLNRDEVGKSNFGSEDYSKEELTAEIASCFLAGELGIAPRIEQSAAYIDNWRSRLGEDKKLVVQAAARAQKAADYILGKESNYGHSGDSDSSAPSRESGRADQARSVAGPLGGDSRDR